MLKGVKQYILFLKELKETLPKLAVYLEAYFTK